MSLEIQGNVARSNPIQMDNSSGVMFVEPAGDTFRGIGSSWFNAENVAREDWIRDQQAQQNAFMRDMAQMGAANAFTAEQNQLNRDFNASQAQIDRDFKVDFAKNEYAYAVEGMKAAGLNPNLAYSQGGASAPSSSPASASGSTSSASPSRGGSGYRSSKGDDPLNGIVQTVARLVATYVSGKIGIHNDLLRDSARLDKELSNALTLETAKADSKFTFENWKMNTEHVKGSKKYWQNENWYRNFK